MKKLLLLFLVSCSSLTYVQPEDYEEDDLYDVEPDYRYSGLDGFIKPMGPPAPTPTPIKKKAATRKTSRR